MPTNEYKTYVCQFLGITALVIGIIFTTNCYIDPLWHFRGNLYSGINYAFNERESKLNLFLNTKNKYDCIMFGSSATTTLDVENIKNHRCFNFSFKGGGIRDFIDYAKYIKNKNFDPSLVVIAVDLYAFQLKDLTSYAPDYVKTYKMPPNAAESYVSWDALNFSLRSMMKWDPGPQNYDKNFNGIITPIRHKIAARNALPPNLAIYYSTSNSVSPDNAKYYIDMRKVFPNATYIGFVPYRSTKIMQELRANDQLEPMLRAIFYSSKSFDEFYDFSVPTPITIDAKDSYDGFHFGPKTIHHIIEEINGDTDTTFFHLNHETFQHYHDDYLRRLDDYAKTHPEAP